MNKKLRNFILIFLFVASLVIRFYFVFQTPHFSLENSYFTQRQVENILDTGLPLYHDSLSFSGTSHAFMPLFYYIIAFFSFFMPFALVGKFIPNIFASTIVFFSFILAKRITKNDVASLMTAFISAFIPIYFIETLNNISPFSIVIPLILYLIYCFIEEKQKQFIVLSFLLTLIHFSTVIVTLGFLVFLLISKIEHFNVKRQNIEFTMFSVVLNLWLLFVFYKRAFLFHGLEIIYKNIPMDLIGQHFFHFNLIQAIYLIGIVPFIYAVKSIYEFLFRKRFFEGFLMLSLIITPVILLWFALIEVSSGLIFLGVFMTILFSSHYESISQFLKKSKFSKLRYYKYYFVISSIIIFTVSSVVPSFVLSSDQVQNSLSEQEFEALEWINQKTPIDSVILASLQEGDVISAIAGRKNVMDTNFLLVNNINLRNREYSKMFNSPYKVETTALMDKYGVNYVYLSKRNDLKVSNNKFNGDCFELVFSNEKVEIFEVKCKLRT